MDHEPDPPSSPYTCTEYRAEMILLALHRKLQRENLGEGEKAELLRDIARLEKTVGLS